VAVWSQHRAGWLGFCKCTPGRHRARHAIGTAMIVTLSYLSILLSCAHPDGKYLASSVVQSFAHASITSTTPERDTAEELCKIVHKQVVALQAFSIGPIFGVTSPRLDIAIGEEAPLLIARLNAFRPPGNGISPAKVIDFRLSAVLRI
jgi:hypothetical protein